MYDSNANSITRGVLFFITLHDYIVQRYQLLMSSINVLIPLFCIENGEKGSHMLVSGYVLSTLFLLF